MIGSITRDAQPSARTTLLVIVLALTGMAALVMPSIDLAWPGRILHWHLQQPGYGGGLLELLAVGLVLWPCLAWRSIWTTGIALAVIGLYLRRHHVDLPALLAVLHLEMLVALGVVIQRLGGRPAGDRLADALMPFMIGVMTWTLVALALSLLGVGRPGDLKIAAAIMMIAAFATARTRPVVFRAWSALQLQRGVSLLIGVGFIVVMLGWLARTNNGTGHDSLWYGLRPQYVLAPLRSFFDQTGLVSPVYYFPKLYELLTAPLAAFRDPSYPFAFGACLLGLFAAAVWRFARALGIPRRLALAASLATITIPAIGNTALSAKTDVIAALLGLLATYWSWVALRQRGLAPFCWALAALMLASACKLIALPYAAALALGVALALTFNSRRTAQRWCRPGRFDWIILVLAALASIGIHARTWWLTGMPTVGPEPLVHLWRWLGMEMREPIGTLAWLQPQQWHDVPSMIYEMLLAPAVLKHIIVSWTGNIWLWLMLAGTLAATARYTMARSLPPVTIVALLTPILLMGFYLALGIGHMTRGGDGNYVIVPIACAMVAGLTFADRSTRGLPSARCVILAMLLAASAMQFAFSFLNSHWGEPGSRAIDLDFTRSTFDGKHMRDRALLHEQLDDMATVLADKPAGYHVIAILDNGFAGNWLPAMTEDIDSILFARPEYLMSETAFLRLLTVAAVDGLIVPIDPEKKKFGNQSLANAIEQLRNDPRVIRTPGARYELLDIREIVGR